MEYSEKYNFYLPSRDGDDIADVNQISDNFRIIEENIPSKKDLDDAVGNVKIEVDQIYDPTSKNAQSGIAVAEAIVGVEDTANIARGEAGQALEKAEEALATVGGATDNWELVEEITVTEDAVVQRKYSGHYKKFALFVTSNNGAKQPRFRLTCGGLFWEFNSYAADTYDMVSIVGEIVIPNVFQDVYAVAGDSGSNPYQARPITVRMFNAASYFDGFKSTTACKVGTTIKVYGVKA